MRRAPLVGVAVMSTVALGCAHGCVGCASHVCRMCAGCVSDVSERVRWQDELATCVEDILTNFSDKAKPTTGEIKVTLP